MRQRFEGAIAGAGSTSGVRIVIGRWVRSPLGRFADAMIERDDGHRVLLAPDERIADFVTATYRFDEVRCEPVLWETSPVLWRWRSPSLSLDLHVGDRTALGAVLSAVPRRLATAPAWCAVTDPLARVLMRGVRTRGSAGQGRREWYAATDLHRVSRLAGSFDGADLGDLADVDPPCRFGFSSTPRRPAVTRVVTTVAG